MSLLPSLEKRVERPTKTEEQQEEALKDPVWRIFNLYRIINKHGESVPFKPKLVQQKVIEAVFVRNERKILILKARQQGFSTLIAIILVDAFIFTDNAQLAIVDQTQGDAAKKLAKCKFALNGLSEIKELDDVPKAVVRDNDNGYELTNGSKIQAGLNARGGTHNYLHVSEWGPIAYEDPSRSNEIKTGALPSAEKGTIFIESTFKGNKCGDFYDLIHAARNTAEEDRTEMDYRLFFFPWWADPDCQLDGNTDQVDSGTTEYLNSIEKVTGTKLTPKQRLWYVKTAATQGLDMQQEYPSTLEEALSARVKGAIYEAQMRDARKEGRICLFDWDRAYPVHTSWDLGNSDWTVIWFFQIIFGKIYAIDYYRSRKQPAPHYTQILRERNYNYGTYALPHDADNAVGGGSGWRAELVKAGIPSGQIKVVDRCLDIWLGINDVYRIMPRIVWHEEKCDEGIRAHESYHTDDDRRTVKPKPVHDESSHPCDALRTFASALAQGKIDDISAIGGIVQDTSSDVDFSIANTLTANTRLPAKRMGGSVVYDQMEVET